MTAFGTPSFVIGSDIRRGAPPPLSKPELITDGFTTAIGLKSTID